jgi:hypothetical protein
MVEPEMEMSEPNFDQQILGEDSLGDNTLSNQVNRDFNSDFLPYEPLAYPSYLQ